MRGLLHASERKMKPLRKHSLDKTEQTAVQLIHRIAVTMIYNCNKNTDVENSKWI